MSIISSLLVMSTKYDVPIIRRDTIQHLSLYFPNNLETFDDLRDHGSTRPQGLFGNEGDCDYFKLLSAARRGSAEILLPALMYLCSTEDTKVLFEHQNVISSEDFHAILKARRLLEINANTIGLAFMLHSDYCRGVGCQITKSELFQVYYERPNAYGKPYSALDRPINVLEGWNGERGQVCYFCVEYCREKLQEARRSCWEYLPEIFGLGSWERLKNGSW